MNNQIASKDTVLEVGWNVGVVHGDHEHIRWSVIHHLIEINPF